MSTSNISGTVICYLIPCSISGLLSILHHLKEKEEGKEDVRKEGAIIRRQLHQSTSGLVNRNMNGGGVHPMQASGLFSGLLNLQERWRETRWMTLRILVASVGPVKSFENFSDCRSVPQNKHNCDNAFFKQCCRVWLHCWYIWSLPTAAGVRLYKSSWKELVTESVSGHRLVCIGL